MKQKALSASLQTAPSYGEQLVCRMIGQGCHSDETQQAGEMGWQSPCSSTKANAETGTDRPHATVLSRDCLPGEPRCRNRHGVLRDKRARSQQCTPTAGQANQILGCVNKSTASPLLNTGEAESRTQCHILGSQQRDSQQQRDRQTAECSNGVSQTVMRLEHKTCKQKVRAGFVQSGKLKSKGASTSVLHYLDGTGILEDKGRFFSETHNKKTRSNSHKMQQRIFQWNIRKMFLNKEWLSTGALPREAAGSPSFWGLSSFAC